MAHNITTYSLTNSLWPDEELQHVAHSQGSRFLGVSIQFMRVGRVLSWAYVQEAASQCVEGRKWAAKEIFPCLPLSASVRKHVADLLIFQVSFHDNGGNVVKCTVGCWKHGKWQFGKGNYHFFHSQWVLRPGGPLSIFQGLQKWHISEQDF